MRNKIILPLFLIVFTLLGGCGECHQQPFAVCGLQEIALRSAL